jgi:hypothetical protein
MVRSGLDRLQGAASYSTVGLTAKIDVSRLEPRRLAKTFVDGLVTVAMDFSMPLVRKRRRVLTIS